MDEPELVLDEENWRYHTSGNPGRSGRLRAWREAGGCVVAMATIRDHHLNDERGLLPEQVRARFPGEQVEVIAYEPSWWGDYEHYYRAVPVDPTYRWEEINGMTLAQRLSPLFMIDDEDAPPGGDPGF